MGVTWYFLVAFMLVVYAVLDGFDFGVGILHLSVARTDAERREVLGSIAPVWDGNEVWLIAAGGVLFFAFPGVYAAAASGLYLPFMMVLWLLILRGLSIELRSKVDHPLWRTAFDTVFSGASWAMAVVLGVALGNVVRGVPVDETGYFHEDLFTNFRGSIDGETGLGALDVYTVLVGVFSLATLAAHGATYLVWKTRGDVHARSILAVRRLWPVVLGLGGLLTAATALTQPAHFAAFAHRPWLWPLPVLAITCALLCPRTVAAGREGQAFLLSCGFIVALLAATVGTLFPALLRSTVEPRFTLDAWSAAAPDRTLGIGLVVWIPAMILAAGYYVFLYRSAHGKVDEHDPHS